MEYICKSLLDIYLFRLSLDYGEYLRQNMSNRKKYLVHISQHRKPLYTTAFNSRTELVVYLRRQGLRFRNDVISNLGEASIKLQSNDSFSYEIEEQIDQRRSIIFEGGEYVPLKDYVESTGESKRTIEYAYKHNKIRGLSVGKRNLIYIYKGDVR